MVFLCWTSVWLTVVLAADNIGSSKTFPLMVSQKVTKRELKLRQSSDFVPLDTYLLESEKFALDQSASTLSSSSGSTALVEENGHDIAYYVEVRLGTGNDKDKIFNVIIDTGSFHTWVYDKDCQCSPQKFFDIDDSTSGVRTGGRFEIGYTTGAVEGEVVEDTFRFCGFKSRQRFGLADKVDSTFAHFPIDGILGLPAQDTDPNHFPGVVSNLLSQNLISTPMFGINLGQESDSSDEGSLTIGGIDSTKYQGDINYIPLSIHDSSGNINKASPGESHLWEIELGGAYIDGFQIDFGGSRTGIVDTGTTLLVMSPSDALKFHGYIQNTQTDGTNFVIPCNTSFTFQLEFNNVKYSIKPENYVGANFTDDSKNSLCISNVQGIQFENDRWILGDVFLKNVYSVYDMNTSQVGFASKQSSETIETAIDSFEYSNNDESVNEAAVESDSLSSPGTATSTSSSKTTAASLSTTTGSMKAISTATSFASSSHIALNYLQLFSLTFLILITFF